MFCVDSNKFIKTHHLFYEYLIFFLIKEIKKLYKKIKLN